MRFFNVQKQRGFTFVEVLIAVAIVAILASIVIPNVQSAKKKARDAQRYSDLSNIQLALRLYKDSNGSYPSTGGGVWTVCTNGQDPTARDITGPSGYIPNLAPGYLPVLPVDPMGCRNDPGAYNGYIYQSNGVDYKVAADWSAEQGLECGYGERYHDEKRTTDTTATKSAFCSISTPGAITW